MVLSQIMSNSVNFVFFSQTDWSGGLTNITLTRELISEQFIFWKLLTIEWQSVGTEQSKHSMNWMNLNPKYWTNVWRRELMKKMYIKHKLIMGNNVCRPLLISHGLYFLHPRPVWRVSSPLIFVIVFICYLYPCFHCCGMNKWHDVLCANGLLSHYSEGGSSHLTRLQGQPDSTLPLLKTTTCY